MPGQHIPLFFQAGAGTSVALGIPVKLASDLVAVRRATIYWQQIEQCTLVLVGLVLSLPHAKNTLDTYGPIGPDRDESTRAAFDAVITARPEHRRTALRQSGNGAGHDPSSGQTS
jgi:hypothetical protein